ncbi:hypothetical protein KJ695_05320 [Patescibacteria group bacterium]|nr:hypothetical protein [Patescibacteria group bacterium]
MSGTTNYNISGDFTGNIIFQDLRSKGDHVSELAKREQMREQEREKDPKIGMSAKEPKHQESTTTNVALNKPVAGIYLDIKRVDDSESGKAKKRFALAVDGRRLSSFVGYHERHSINQGGYACNLTDGDLATRAYPADFAFDYIIDLKQKYQLTEIRLNWGSFGEQIEKHNYITRWEVYGQDSFTSEVFPDLKSDWMLIKSGGIPRKRSETIKGKELEQHTFWRLRIRAFSDPAVENRQANWIGIYEVEAYGIPLNNN